MGSKNFARVTLKPRCELSSQLDYRLSPPRKAFIVLTYLLLVVQSDRMLLLLLQVLLLLLLQRLCAGYGRGNRLEVVGRGVVAAVAWVHGGTVWAEEK